MLYYIISDPNPSHYTDLMGRVRNIKDWVKEMKAKKKIISMYQKVDKGSVILLNVESNEELNQILAEWMKVVDCPVEFQIIPVIVPTVLED